MVTLAAVAALVMLGRQPFLGVPNLMRDGVPLLPRMLAFGFVPFAAAFQFVEVLMLLVPAWRARRVGGALARAPFERVAWVLGFAFLALQTVAMLRFVGSLAEVNFPGLLWAQLFGAHVLMLGLAVGVGKFGLGNGFAMLTAVNVADSIVQELAPKVLSQSVSLGAIALLALGFAAGAYFFLQGRQRSPGPVPTTMLFPVASLQPWFWAAAAMSLPATLGAFVPEAMALQRALQSNRTLYTALFVFLAFDATLLLGFVFFRPAAIGDLWAKWVPNVDHIGVVAAARPLLVRMLMLSMAFGVAWPLALLLLDLPISGAAVLGLAPVAALVDVGTEWSATRRLGPLVSIFELSRTAEVEPVLQLLHGAGIEGYARSASIRATQQFFGPWIAISVMVPRAREAEARALLEARPKTP
jgi:hypothetical protein